MRQIWEGTSKRPYGYYKSASPSFPFGSAPLLPPRRSSRPAMYRAAMRTIPHLCKHETYHEKDGGDQIVLRLVDPEVFLVPKNGCLLVSSSFLYSTLASKYRISVPFASAVLSRYENRYLHVSILHHPATEVSLTTVRNRHTGDRETATDDNRPSESAFSN